MKKRILTKLERYWDERDKKYEVNKKKYKGPHCCLLMHYVVDKNNPTNVSPDSYNPKFRGYYLSATQGYGGEKINFCPRCGSKLPAELSDFWFEILEKEYGLDNPTGLDQRNRIPPEFNTDEWWKKRGL